MALATRYRLKTGYVIEMFHVEHKVDLVSLFAVLVEQLFVHDGKGADPAAETGFFKHFAFKGCRRLLAKLHVPTWEVEIVVLDVPTKKHGVLSDEQAASEYFDSFLGHDASLLGLDTLYTVDLVC